MVRWSRERDVACILREHGKLEVRLDLGVLYAIYLEKETVSLAGVGRMLITNLSHTG